MAKTVKSRVPEYEKDIPLQLLPRTICDAVVATHGIGLRYLWVDAMCIVQDDGDDMAEQIGQMHAVYRSAYVTISAATAATSKEVPYRCTTIPLNPTSANIPTGLPSTAHRLQTLHSLRSPR